MEKFEQLQEDLFIAIGERDLEKVRSCVKQARKIGKKNEIINDEKDYMRPIHHAVCVDSLKILQFLLHNGADINAVSSVHLSFFFSPDMIKNKVKRVIHYCHSGSNSEVMRGFTALHLAAFYCRTNIVKSLLHNKNIDIRVKNLDGKTAFDVIGGYETPCSNSYKIQKMLLAVSKRTIENCKALYTIDVTSNTLNSPFATTEATTKIVLEANNIANAASSIVNPSFSLARANLKEASSMVSSAVRPSSFINSIFSWIGASTTAALDRSTSALPSAQQSVAGEINFSGAALLTDVIVRKFTGEKYSRPLDDSFLTAKQIKERKLNSLERDVKMALSKCEKIFQRPGSSLNNSTTVYNFKTSVQI